MVNMYFRENDPLQSIYLIPKLLTLQSLFVSKSCNAFLDSYHLSFRGLWGGRKFVCPYLVLPESLYLRSNMHILDAVRISFYQDSVTVP